MAVGHVLAAPGPTTAGRLDQRAFALVASASLVAAGAFLIAPPMGVDLAAQVWHSEFFGRHGAAVLDFGWYGGTSPYGYSLLTPALMSFLGGGIAGAKMLGALAAVAASVLLTLLLQRTGARRVLLAGLLGALGIFGNIVSGRVTFTAGLAFGLAALLALTWTRPWPRRAGALAGAVLAAAASPVAGLFVGLAGVAVLLGRRRRWDGLLLAAGAGLSLFVTSVVFGADGPMNTIGSDTLRSCTVSLLVAILVPRPAVRVGALLSAAGVLAAALLTTPVGLNAGRLSATFALATIAGYAVLPSFVKPPAALAAVLAAVLLWQHPVAVNDLRHAGDPSASAAYFRPLLTELQRRRTAGRVEVVPTADYWEAAYVPPVSPLARGWLRQADTARDPVFFAHLTRASYQSWLLGDGVTLVALANTAPAPVGRQEALLVRGRPPYLSRVWRGGAWTLYAVAGTPALVTGNATLVSSTDAGAVVDAAGPGQALVRVRWSRWLAVRGPAGCIEPAPGGWTTLLTRASGRYTLTGSLRPGPAC